MAFDASTNDFEGTILDFSDSGERTRAFAVVEVVWRRSFVVPVDQLTILTRGGEGER